MPGPNDFHYNDKGILMPGLGPQDPKNGMPTVRSGPRLDGRTTEAKRLRAIEETEKQLAKERAAFEAEKKELRAKAGAT